MIAAALFSVVLVCVLGLLIVLRADPATVEPQPSAALPTPIDARIDFNANSGTLITGQRVTLEDGRSIVLQPWDGETRFTILLLGLDRRPGESSLAYRTDTIMLVSIDPATDSMGILSIPRDLYVEVPGYSELQRVNTPMVLGELEQPGNGPQLAMETVQYNLGIRVQNYLVVDFNAFVQFVEVLDGIDINIPYDIADYQYPDMNYGYDPFVISAGIHHLNGEDALKYARTRHGDSDLVRARRQQQVIFAIRDRVLDANGLPQLIVQSPALWRAFRENVYTGLTLDEIIQLGWYLKDIDPSNIRTGVVDGDYVMDYMTPGGAAVLVPRRAQLGALMAETFGASYSQ